MISSKTIALFLFISIVKVSIGEDLKISNAVAEETNRNIYDRMNEILLKLQQDKHDSNLNDNNMAIESTDKNINKGNQVGGVQQRMSIPAEGEKGINPAVPSTFITKFNNENLKKDPTGLLNTFNNKLRGLEPDVVVQDSNQTNSKDTINTNVFSFQSYNQTINENTNITPAQDDLSPTALPSAKSDDLVSENSQIPSELTKILEALGIKLGFDESENGRNTHIQTNPEDEDNLLDVEQTGSFTKKGNRGNEKTESHHYYYPYYYNYCDCCDNCGGHGCYCNNCYYY